jgi:predicted DNA-binding transcriptional regulator AlpA
MTRKSTRTVAPDRRALTVNETVRLYPIGRTFLYQLMKRGVVQSVKLGGRRMILIDSLEGRYTVTKARKAKAEGAE